MNKDEDQEVYHNAPVFPIYDPDLELNTDDADLCPIPNIPPEFYAFSTIEQCVQYILSQVKTKMSNEEAFDNFWKWKHGKYEKTIGVSNTNHLFDTRVYMLDFPHGTIQDIFIEFYCLESLLPVQQ